MKLLELSSLDDLRQRFGSDVALSTAFGGAQPKGGQPDWYRTHTAVVASRSTGTAVLLYIGVARGSVLLQQRRKDLGRLHPNFQEAVIPASLLAAVYDLAADATNSAGIDPSLITLQSATVTDKQFEEICMRAIEQNASDIHLRVRNDGGESSGEVLFRIDGELELFTEIEPKKLLELISAAYAKSDAKSIAEGQGQWSLSRPYGSFIRIEKVRNVELRFQSNSERYGADAVMRVLNYEGRSEVTGDLRSSGYLPSQIELLEEAGYGPGGSVLMIGETGSGKTTSLTALIRNHQGLVSRRLYAAAVEDPPEGRPKNLSQFPVARSAETGGKGAQNPFTTALRALMRMDGDVILLGEIRDGATAEMWQELCLTGHKIYATFHAPSSIGGIERLCSSLMGLHPETVASSDVLSLAAFQKLVPRLCPECKVRATEDGVFAPKKLRALESLGIDPKDTYVRYAAGCGKCRGGKKGVQVVAEMFNPKTEQRRLIAAGKFSEAFYSWRETRGDTPFTSAEVQGKTAFEVGLYFASQGIIGVDTLDQVVDRILAHDRVNGAKGADPHG